MSTSITGQEDFCTFVPDAPFGFNFKPNCSVHDDNYGPMSTISREAADNIFRESLHETCSTQYGGSWLCHLSAEIYFIGVRLFGGLFYEGPGGD